MYPFTGCRRFRSFAYARYYILMKALFSGSIRQMVMLVVFLSVLPPFVILLVSGVQNYQESYADAKRRSLRIVEGISEREQAVSENTLAILTALHQVSAFKSFEDAFSTDVFSNLIDEYPVFENIYTMSISGAVLSSGLPVPRGMATGELVEFARSLKGAPYAIDSYAISPFTAMPVKRFVLPLEDRKNEIFAYLFAELDLYFFGDIFVGHPIPEGGTVYLLSEQGELTLSTSFVGQNILNSLANSLLWQNLVKEKEASGGFLFTDEQGAELFAVFTRVFVPGRQSPHLTTVMTVPQSHVFEAPSLTLHRDIILVCGSGVVALVVGLLLCHWGFVLPIMWLSP